MTAPPSPLDQVGPIQVALGMTDIDALTALVASHQEQNSNTGAVDVLQAFQYGLLPVLEQVNGPELVANAIHAAGFASARGGTTWAIAPASGNGSTAAPLTSDEAAWLQDLNAAQTALDAARLDLADAQWGLYALWWKWQKGLAIEAAFGPPAGFDKVAYAQAVQTTMPAVVAAASAAVAAALAHVPRSIPAPGRTSQAAFEAGLAAFAAAKGLADDKVLKALPGPRYWQGSDPVVLLSGIGSTGRIDPAGSLTCRLASAAVAELTVGTTIVTAANLGSVLPMLPASGASEACQALLTEAFLLDEASAPAIAAASGLAEADIAAAIKTHSAPAYAGQTLPGVECRPWRQQPWTPLFMEWQADYLPIPYTADGQPNWTFDGCDYRYTGPVEPSSADLEAVMSELNGISLLTPHTQVLFRKRLLQFIGSYVDRATDPPADLRELASIDKLIDGIDDWQLMSQALTGFSDQIAMRDTRAQRAPGPAVEQDVARQTHAVPCLPDAVPGLFAGVRHGQFAFTSLLVYDAYGQVLEVIADTGLTDSQSFEPILDPALLPDRPVIARNSQRLIEVRPRVIQPARLDFLLVDGTDDTRVVGASVDANPVCGWLLPNHLDRSLLLYAPDGSALGSFRLLADARGTTSTRWQPPPHSSLTFDEVAVIAPRLAGVIGDQALADPIAFTTFLATIDSTLWTADPLGNRADVSLSVLIGRPLALVRARLSLALHGAPIADLTAWATTWPPPTPEFIEYDFAVRLGDQATRSDGLVGYYAGNDTTAFNSVPIPDQSARQGYVRAIGPVGQLSGGNYLSLRFDGASTAFVTMLLDPRADVHALTGILPVKTLQVPAAFVDAPLSALEVTFTANGLLTTVGATPASGAVPPVNSRSVSVPIPAEQGGTWTWWEPSSGASAWSAYALARATPDATFTNLPATVRDGYLQLTIDLQASSRPTGRAAPRPGPD